jgi:lipase
MVLKTRRWGRPEKSCVACVHGVAQHGGIFAGLGERLAQRGLAVVAVDLRGHGESGREPPWDTETHVDDLFETLEAEGVERVTWVGHSFGGRLAAAAAARVPERTEGLVLLDPGLGTPPQLALRSAEVERLDWSFAGVDGALAALLSNASMVAPPRETVAAYVRDDLRQGPDGRYRFSFSPSAVVVAWSEMARPIPSIAPVPTLIVRAEVSPYEAGEVEARYREALGELLTLAPVPNGHNVLWESPTETFAAIEGFLGPE